MNYNSQKRIMCDYTVPAHEMIEKLITNRSYTIPMIAEKVGRSTQTVRAIIKRWHGMKEKKVYIAKWDRPRSSQIIPRYRMGNLDDEPKPKPLKRSTIFNRYHATEKYKAHLERKRVKKIGLDSVVNQIIKQDTLMSVLFM